MKNIFVLMVSGIFMLLSVNLFSQGYGYGDREGNRYRDRDKIHEKLNLTEEQEAQMENLRIDHRTRMIELRAELEKKELEFQQLKNSIEYTRNEYLAKTNELNEIRTRIQLSKANHQMDVYEMLDPEQKKTWNDFRKGFFRHKDLFRKNFHRNRFEL